MFFSKIVFNYKNNEVVDAYDNCQKMHTLIMTAFPKEKNSVSPRSKYGVIYRIIEKQSILMAYVYSKVIPNWKPLMESEILMSAETKNINEFISGIKNGDVYKFQLSVFISKRPKNKETGESSPNAIQITSKQGRLDWLERVSKNNGFKIIHSEEIEKKIVRGIKNRTQNRFTLTTISGVLTVTDAESFIYAYTEGIGRCKAYGAGMLLLSKLEHNN